VSKYRVAFNLDLAQIAPSLDAKDPSERAAAEVVTTMLINAARLNAKDELQKVRRDPSLESDVKVIRMAEQMRKMMLTLMAEANLEVTHLANDTVISTKLPFEEGYEKAA
jgi:hypothetical protein